MLKFEDCKKILNKNNEHYTDDQIKEMMALLDYWARINAKAILKKLKEIENQQVFQNVDISCKFYTFIRKLYKIPKKNIFRYFT